MKMHNYKTVLEWTDNTGKGTESYRSYDRNHKINATGKGHSIMGSSDSSFLGDASRYNPEELFFLQFLPVTSFGICTYVRRIRLRLQNITIMPLELWKKRKAEADVLYRLHCIPL